MGAPKEGFDFLPISLAGLLVYREVMARRLGDIQDPVNSAILNDVAHALSNVAVIYVTKLGPAAFEPLEPVEVIHAAFERGGSILKTPQAEYENPAIRRSDMLAAIEIFRRSGISFQPRTRPNGQEPQQP